MGCEDLNLDSAATKAILHEKKYDSDAEQRGLWNKGEKLDFVIDQQSKSMCLKDEMDVNINREGNDKNKQTLNLEGVVQQDSEELKLREAIEVTHTHVGNCTYSHGNVSDGHEVPIVVTNSKTISTRYLSSKNSEGGKNSEVVKRYLGGTSLHVSEGDWRHELSMETQSTSDSVGYTKEKVNYSVDIDADTYEEDFE